MDLCLAIVHFLSPETLNSLMVKDAIIVCFVGLLLAVDTEATSCDKMPADNTMPLRGKVYFSLVGIGIALLIVGISVEGLLCR